MAVLWVTLQPTLYLKCNLWPVPQQQRQLSSFLPNNFCSFQLFRLWFTPESKLFLYFVPFCKKVRLWHLDDGFWNLRLAMISEQKSFKVHFILCTLVIDDAENCVFQKLRFIISLPGDNSDDTDFVRSHLTRDNVRPSSDSRSRSDSDLTEIQTFSASHQAWQSVSDVAFPWTSAWQWRTCQFLTLIPASSIS